MLSRRNFIKNAAGILVAAPMVVKAESLMGVNKSLIITDDFEALFRKVWFRKEAIELDVGFDPARPGDDIIMVSVVKQNITRLIEQHYEKQSIKALGGFK